MYASFYDEVQVDVNHAEWPLVVRNRLGLVHYGSFGPRPWYVALMRYSMSEVLEASASSGHKACALPTVLDGGMHEFFFPAPRESPYGVAMQLDPTRSVSLTSELLHHRIEYRPEHIYRIGQLIEVALLSDALFAEVRNSHLLALRASTHREDFGELFEGRT